MKYTGIETVGNVIKAVYFVAPNQIKHFLRADTSSTEDHTARKSNAKRHIIDSQHSKLPIYYLAEYLCMTYSNDIFYLHDLLQNVTPYIAIDCNYNRVID